MFLVAATRVHKHTMSALPSITFPRFTFLLPMLQSRTRYPAIKRRYTHVSKSHHRSLYITADRGSSSLADRRPTQPQKQEQQAAFPSCPPCPYPSSPRYLCRRGLPSSPPTVYSSEPSSSDPLVASRGFGGSWMWYRPLNTTARRRPPVGVSAGSRRGGEGAGWEPVC